MIRAPLEQNLAAMERSREAHWLRYRSTSPLKLHWRATAVRHVFHMLPGESILELGAGGAAWTSHLTGVLRGENPITAAVFHKEAVPDKDLKNVRFAYVEDIARDLPQGSFDYIVGTDALDRDFCGQMLEQIFRLLKPGGQWLFFESRLRRNGIGGSELAKIAARQGFGEVDAVPYDIIPARTPRFLAEALEPAAFIAEHMPVVRQLCGTVYIRAQKPGGERPSVNLARHQNLSGAVSFVTPCHNEEMNVPGLVEKILAYYGPYVHEILIVNDNSTDRTAEVTREIAAREPRVRLIDRRPPKGVGRALRDGYAAASGRYILSMDCDFVQILPEMRDLFDAVAAGRDGAIGSRFSHESLLINYPFVKILCNRGFHLLANLALPRGVRDISNNLKLYRAEIFKEMEIEQGHFAANAETGLKPILAGYDIQETPVSWINRTPEMGRSSFRVARVAASYFQALASTLWKNLRGRAVAQSTAKAGAQ